MNEPAPAKVKKKTYTPWYYSKFFSYAFAVLLILTIILLFSQVTAILTPVFDFASILFIPIVFSVLFYYFLRPSVYFLDNLKVPHFLSIIIVYFLIAISLVLFFAFLVPILAVQITAIANTSVDALEKMKNSSYSISLPGFEINLEGEIQERLLSSIQYVTSILSRNFLDIFKYVTHLATLLAVIPFIVFYLLKDDQSFMIGFLKHVPEKFGKEVHKILKNIDETLSSYINGLLLISFSVGAMLFVGYLIIGLNYALILSVIALVLTSIPYLGPFLAITPAILVGISESPFMALKVMVVFIIVQQIESNVISPQVIGQKLNIHPLTLILLLLAAGSLYGLIGLLLATPFYAVLKVLFVNLYKIYLLRYPKIQASFSNP
ncbi:MAG: AI-2E family transporter [Candidatus Protochlamydia sp.]|nr:AI-2E family transporter [Candidatus Protochlamydia sp.]